jgi:hypothetical protein
MSPVFEFAAFVLVKADNASQAQRIAEKTTEEVETSNPSRARAALDDGPPVELEEEDF